MYSYMYSYKKLSLMLLVLLITSAAITIATRNSHSQNNANTKKKVKVLRRHDQLGQPPTVQEIAAASQEGTGQVAQQVRELEDKIPKHLPIKVKVKNLKNEKWARDLEIEVENRSNKPIYFLLLLLDLPDVLTENNHKLGFPLSYGRGDLVDFSTPLQPDDVPIRPGESYTFKIPERLRQGWERFVTRRGLSKDVPKKVRLVFQVLNFGDGTGFGTTGGVPVDPPPAQADNSWRHREKLEEPAVFGLNKPPGCSSAILLQPSSHSLPAKFLPVNFSPANTFKSVSSESLTHSDICCPGLPCSRLKLRRVSCCGEIFKAFYAGCTERGGFCSSVEEDRDVPCNDSAGTYCIEDTLAPCSSGEPTPTATPTPTSTSTPTPPPTPTPTPCPTPDYTTQPNPSCTPLPALTLDACYGYIWHCNTCTDGVQADYPANGQTGCPGNMYNTGDNCCKCVQPPQSCQQGYVWSTSSCQCVPNNSGGGSGDNGGGGGGSYECTEYWWVTYECGDGGGCREEGREYAGCW